jgi:hypothetical protein
VSTARALHRGGFCPVNIMTLRFRRGGRRSCRWAPGSWSYLNGSSRQPTVGSLCVEYPAVGRTVGVPRPRAVVPVPLVHVDGSGVWGSWCRGNVRRASCRCRPRARPRRWSVAVAGARWSGPGGGSVAVVLVVRWRRGVVMRGVCRAWSGRASGGLGRRFRVEDRAPADSLVPDRVPKLPGKPNIPRSFSTVVTGGLRVRGAAGVTAGVRCFGPSGRDRRLGREPSRGPVFTVGLWHGNDNDGPLWRLASGSGVARACRTWLTGTSAGRPVVVRARPFAAGSPGQR